MAGNRYHAAVKLDVLQLLNDYDRSCGARHLLQVEDSKRTGVMLFKYHALADTSLITTSTASSRRWEAAAEQCFDRFTDEQKRFWVTQTAKLIKGDCMPLGPNRFLDFATQFPDAIKVEAPEEVEELLIDLEFDETPESSPSKSERTDSPASASSQSSVEMSITSSRKQMSGSPSGRTGYLHGELGFEAPPAPYIPRKYRQGDGIWRSSVVDMTETRKYPILKLLCKRQTLSKLSHQEIISTILRFLEDRIDRDEESHLVGRFRGMRLNYDAGATNVRSIQARLTASMTRKVFVDEASHPVKDVLAEMEALMRPFAVWNSGLWTMSEFETIEIPGRHDGHTYTDDYDSCSGWFEREFSQLLPVGQGNKNAVVNAILGFLREKAQLYYRSRPLLQYSTAELAFPHHPARRADKYLYLRVKNFGLKDRKSGFATQLLSCFDRPDLSPEEEEYLDFIEQKVYLFHKEFPEFNLMETPA